MATRKEILEAFLFLPAMVLLAGAVFGLLYLVIQAGNGALTGWHLFLSRILALPRPVSLALAVLLAALTIYGVVYLALRPRRLRNGRRL